jgi:hypothetical protein
MKRQKTVLSALSIRHHIKKILDNAEVNVLTVI